MPTLEQRHILQALLSPQPLGNGSLAPVLTLRPLLCPQPQLDPFLRNRVAGLVLQVMCTYWAVTLPTTCCVKTFGMTLCLWYRQWRYLHHPLSLITAGCRRARRLVTAASWSQRCCLSCCPCLPAQQHIGSCTAARFQQHLMILQAPLCLSQLGTAQAQACASACDRHLSFQASLLQVRLHKRGNCQPAHQM